MAKCWWNHKQLSFLTPASGILSQGVQSLFLIFFLFFVSGCPPAKALRMFSFLGLESICDRTFFAHQQAVLLPCIRAEWSLYQKNYLTSVNNAGRKVILGGDGRADSPGHSAKYGTYTCMDLDIMQVVNVETVQVNRPGRLVWVKFYFFFSLSTHKSKYEK